MTDKQEKKLHGTYAEFDAVDTLLAACRRVRDAGYTKTDAFTPFPVHGIDKALGIKPTVLPWIALACGLVGTTIGLAMQIFMNTIDYPYIISGKPFFSMPAFIPVSFELTILLASFGAFFGMLALNGLPKFSNPMFTDPRFDRATDDKFFLFIDAADARFNHAGVKKLLGDLGGGHIQDVFDDNSGTAIPKPIFVLLGSVIFLSLIPLLLVARMRVTTSGSPRFHVFYDMDFSPAKAAQSTSSLFADARAMRPDVPGTVAVGQLSEEVDFYTGIDMNALAKLDQRRATRLVRALLYPDDLVEEAADEPAKPADEPANPADEPAKPADESAKPADEPAKPADEPAKPADEPANPADEPAKPADESAKPADEPAKPADESAKPADESAKPADEPAKPIEPAVVPAVTQIDAATTGAAPTPLDTTPWLKQNPLPLSLAVLERGRTQFGIYCATCHGNDGRGNGLVNQRAQRILATAWVQPSSMHQDTLYTDAYPDGKLFSTISNGIRKMPGYASQINVRDRWAIVAYVRALQASQNASIDDLPVDKRNELSKLKTEVDRKITEQAQEAERKRAEAEVKKPAT